MIRNFTYIEDIISEAKDEEISYRTLHIPVVITDMKNDKIIKIPYMSLTNKYRDFLEKIVVELNLSDQERQYYKFRPKLLSEKLYGTTELWYTLLELNNIKSIIEFDINTIKLYDPNEYKKYFNEILILEGIIK